MKTTVKRTLSLLLAAASMASVLTACGSKDTAAADTSADTQAASASADASDLGPVLTRIKESGEMVIATASGYMPYEFVDISSANQDVIGVDMALGDKIIEKLSDKLGVEVKGYADLLQPELKGKIAMGDPTASSSAFAELTNMLLDMGEGDTPADRYMSDAAWDYIASCCPALLRCTRTSSPVSMPWAFPTRTPLCRPSSTTRTTPTPTCRWCTPKRVPCGCPPVSPS